MCLIEQSKTVVLLGTVLFSSAIMANQAPTIDPLNDQTVPVGQQVEFRVTPRDPEGVVPGLRVIDIPAGALFSDNGDGTRSFKWLPKESDTGSVRLTFEAIDAQDNSLRNSRTITITVTPRDPGGCCTGNLPPEFESLTDQQLTIGGSFDFRVVPRDPEGVVPALSIDPLPEGARFDDNFDGTRQFRWTPSSAHLGEHRIKFTAFEESDSSIRTERTITLRVDDSSGPTEPPTGDAPQFVDLNDQFLYLGQTLNLVVKAQSKDGTVPGLAVDRQPVDSAFFDNGNGTRTFRWYPYPVNLGDTWLTFYAIDSKDASIRTQKTIRIRVERDPNNPVNFPPYINGINNPTIRAGDTLNQLIEPKDPDFTVPVLNALNLPPNAQFVDNGDGTRDFRWSTTRNDLGDHTFHFRVKDSEDQSLQFDSSFSVTVAEPSSFNRSGERLRTLADRRDFLIGYATILNTRKIADNELYRQIASDEFNIVTPENSHKMGWIQPQRGVFDWEDADDVANFAAEKGMVLHGHPLVWHAQLPGWVLFMDHSEARNIMREHIQALAGRYRGRVKIWDVVNEAMSDSNGEYRNSVWYQALGEGYIREAFQMAREADPDAVLVYNDYDVAWKNTKSDAMYNMLEKELNAGTPIDAVGFQMHLRTDFTDFEGMRNNLQRFANLGLDIYITEFDVAMNSEFEEEKQAEIYRRSLEICLAQPKCKAMQSWGFTDRYSWRSNNDPLPLSDKYQPKAAYYAWQSTLRDYLR